MKVMILASFSPLSSISSSSSSRLEVNPGFGATPHLGGELEGVHLRSHAGGVQLRSIFAANSVDRMTDDAPLLANNFRPSFGSMVGITRPSVIIPASFGLGYGCSVADAEAIVSRSPSAPAMKTEAIEERATELLLLCI